MARVLMHNEMFALELVSGGRRGLFGYTVGNGEAVVMMDDAYEAWRALRRYQPQVSSGRLRVVRVYPSFEVVDTSDFVE